MAVRKQASGKWLCERYPRGQVGERFTMEKSKDVALFCYAWY